MREPLPGQPAEPRTWHRYAYAFANPVNFYDPYGQQTCSFNLLTGERECFGERTGMGWTVSLPSTGILPPPTEGILPSPGFYQPPQGAWQCPLGPGEVVSLAQGGWEAWRAFRMVHGGLHFVPGTRYPGQIIVRGTQEAKIAAGLSPYLTHARGLTHPGLRPYLSPQAAGAAQLKGWPTWVGVAVTVGWDVYEYGWGSRREVGLESPEFAAAVTVDVAASLLLPAAGAVAGAAIGAVACGPAAPICAVAGIAAGNVAVAAFSHSGLREWSIEQMSGFYESVLQGFQAGVPPVSPEFWSSEENWLTIPWP